jgi:hypothetical protein
MFLPIASPHSVSPSINLPPEKSARVRCRRLSRSFDVIVGSGRRVSINSSEGGVLQSKYQSPLYSTLVAAVLPAPCFEQRSHTCALSSAHATLRKKASIGNVDGACWPCEKVFDATETADMSTLMKQRKLTQNGNLENNPGNHVGSAIRIEYGIRISLLWTGKQ